MNRCDFDAITSNFPEGSVKKACYVIREYRRCEKSGNLDMCAVSKEEFDSALAILLAFSYQTSDKDTLAEQWQCESDCRSNNCGFCKGEFQIDNARSRKLCKYYLDPDNI